MSDDSQQGGNGAPAETPATQAPAPAETPAIELGPIECVVMLMNRHRKACVCGGVRFTDDEVREFIAGRPWNVQLGRDEQGYLLSVTPAAPQRKIIVPRLKFPAGFGGGSRNGD